MNLRVRLEAVPKGWRYWDHGVRHPARSQLTLYALVDRHKDIAAQARELGCSSQLVYSAIAAVRRYHAQRTLMDMDILETLELTRPGIMERWLASAVSPALAG